MGPKEDGTFLQLHASTCTALGLSTLLPGKTALCRPSSPGDLSQHPLWEQGLSLSLLPCLPWEPGGL